MSGYINIKDLTMARKLGLNGTVRMVWILEDLRGIRYEGQWFTTAEFSSYTGLTIYRMKWLPKEIKTYLDYFLSSEANPKDEYGLTTWDIGGRPYEKEGKDNDKKLL